MKFEFKQDRAAGIGHRIVLKVIREGTEQISSVRTVLDDSELASDDLNPPITHYERIFNQAGTGGPGMHHHLHVTALDINGDPQIGTLLWNDTL